MCKRVSTLLDIHGGTKMSFFCLSVAFVTKTHEISGICISLTRGVAIGLLAQNLLNIYEPEDSRQVSNRN